MHSVSMRGTVKSHGTDGNLECEQLDCPYNLPQCVTQQSAHGRHSIEGVSYIFIVTGVGWRGGERGKQLEGEWDE